VHRLSLIGLLLLASCKQLLPYTGPQVDARSADGALDRPRTPSEASADRADGLPVDAAHVRDQLRASEAVKLVDGTKKVDFTKKDGTVAAVQVTLDSKMGPMTAPWTHLRSGSCTTTCLLVVQVALFGGGSVQQVSCGAQLLSYVTGKTSGTMTVGLWYLKQPPASCLVKVAHTAQAILAGSSAWSHVSLGLVGAAGTFGGTALPNQSSVNHPELAASGSVLLDVAAVDQLAPLAPGSSTQQLWSTQVTSPVFGSAAAGHALCNAGTCDVGWSLVGSLDWVHAWLLLQGS
jgi:hypothetical protein